MKLIITENQLNKLTDHTKLLKKAKTLFYFYSEGLIPAGSIDEDGNPVMLKYKFNKQPQPIYNHDRKRVEYNYNDIYEYICNQDQVELVLLFSDGYEKEVDKMDKSQHFLKVLRHIGSELKKYHILI